MHLTHKMEKLLKIFCWFAAEACSLWEYISLRHHHLTLTFLPCHTNVTDSDYTHPYLCVYSFLLCDQSANFCIQYVSCPRKMCRKHTHYRSVNKPVKQQKANAPELFYQILGMYLLL
jgi:hypothetical protein